MLLDDPTLRAMIDHEPVTPPEVVADWLTDQGVVSLAAVLPLYAGRPLLWDDGISRETLVAWLRVHDRQMVGAGDGDGTCILRADAVELLDTVKPAFGGWGALKQRVLALFPEVEIPVRSHRATAISSEAVTEDVFSEGYGLAPIDVITHEVAFTLTCDTGKVKVRSTPVRPLRFEHADGYYLVTEMVTAPCLIQLPPMVIGGSHVIVPGNADIVVGGLLACDAGGFRPAANASEAVAVALETPRDGRMRIKLLERRNAQ